MNHPNKPRKLVIKITNDQKIEDELKYKAQSLEKPSASPLRPHTGQMKGESPYLPNELKYNCIFSTVVIAFSPRKVLGSNENLLS